MSISTAFAPFAQAFMPTAKVLSGLLAAKTAAPAAAVVGFAQAMRNRRDFELVAQMDHVQLRDLGLAPGDIYYARGLPFGQDPTAELARRSAERHRR